jgi:hypothetical protein
VSKVLEIVSKTCREAEYICGLEGVIMNWQQQLGSYTDTKDMG